jgi:two-component system, OmpR family, KDP operon response regulator KdpE
MHKQRILIVDDDISIIKALRANLAAKDYDTMAAVNGAEAISIVERELPDLIILDIVMPGIDGFEVCRQIRQWSQIPIIMLSARQDEEEKARCLDHGADDYMTKPFGITELIARVGAVLRRTNDSKAVLTTPSFSSGRFRMNFVTHQVFVGEREVKLTPTEYCLLRELALGTGKVFTHTVLLGKVWGPEYAEEREYLRVFINRLRKLIEEDPTDPKYILTIPGVGYRFNQCENQPVAIG